MADPNFDDFTSKYNSREFLQKLKNDVLEKNPNATVDDFANTFAARFPVHLLKGYHQWLLDNYQLLPRDNG